MKCVYIDIWLFNLYGIKFISLILLLFDTAISISMWKYPCNENNVNNGNGAVEEKYQWRNLASGGAAESASLAKAVSQPSAALRSAA